MHEDERAIVKEILGRALGDDDCFGKVVSGDRSESGRAADRLVLARFFERMERQFALRAAARAEGGLAPEGPPDLATAGDEREEPSCPANRRSRAHDSCS